MPVWQAASCALQVALAFFGSANIVEQQREDVAIDRAGAHDLNRRNAKAFLVNLAAWTHGAGEGPTDVGVMGAGGDEEIRCACGWSRARVASCGSMKTRSNHGDVGQMRAAAEGIVQHGDVAGCERELVNGGAHRHGHGAEMHRHVIAHGECVAIGIEERTGVIATLFDVGGEGGAAERGAHLFGDGVEEMLEDIELDGIERHVGECTPGSDGRFGQSVRSEVCESRKPTFAQEIFEDFC